MGGLLGRRVTTACVQSEPFRVVAARVAVLPWAQCTRRRTRLLRFMDHRIFTFRRARGNLGAGRVHGAAAPAAARSLASLVRRRP